MVPVQYMYVRYFYHFPACPTGYLKYESRCLRLPRSVITRWDSAADDFDYDQVTTELTRTVHHAARYGFIS